MTNELVAHTGMDFKINIFKTFIYATYYICASVSPISRERFKSERNRKLPLGDEFENSSSAQFHGPLDWWPKFTNFRRLIELVKRQHMVGNLYILFLCSHLLILIHLNIKSVFHTFYTGSDLKKIEQFNDGFYPHLAGVFPEPYLFNNLFLVAGFLSLAVRFLKIYHLLDDSVRNETFYRKLHITQVNISSFLTCELSLKDWCRFFKYSFEEHPQQQQQQPEDSNQPVNYHKDVVPKKNKHLSNQIDQVSEKHLLDLSQFDLMFYFNPINHEESYSRMNLFADPSIIKHLNSFTDWHCALPVHRVSIESLRNLSLLVVSMCGAITTVPTVALLGLIYLELSSKLNVVRLIELFLFIIVHTPIYVDVLLVQIDLIILICRIHELKLHLDKDLKDCRNGSINHGRHKRAPSIRDEFSYRSSYHEYFSLMSNGHSISQQRRQSIMANSSPRNSLVINHHERYLINQKIFKDIKLVGLVYAEFLNLRGSHSTFLNIIILGNGIYLSYSISLITVMNTFAESTIVILAIISAFLATMISLIVCAGVEREVSLIHNKNAM